MLPRLLGDIYDVFRVVRGHSDYLADHAANDDQI